MNVRTGIVVPSCPDTGDLEVGKIQTIAPTNSSEIHLSTAYYLAAILCSLLQQAAVLQYRKWFWLHLLEQIDSSGGGAEAAKLGKEREGAGRGWIQQNGKRSIPYPSYFGLSILTELMQICTSFWMQYVPFLVRLQWWWGGVRYDGAPSN